MKPPRSAYKSAMNVRCAVFLIVASIAGPSCSKRNEPEQQTASSETERSSEAERESADERRPEEDQIGEDCAAFVRSTKVVGAPVPKADCPTCPAAGTEAFSFRDMKTDVVSCAGDTCSVTVTIRAVFNPGAAGDALAGGLTAWIPPEQRSAYLSGQTPAGEQTFPVQITYKRRGAGWKAAEFDRAASH